MDKQYTGSTFIKLGGNKLFLEPNLALEKPISFKEYYAHADENIYMIANRFYKDTSMWYLIAKFSGIVDPIDIPKGTLILLPTYNDKNPEDLFI